ncbi:MAG: hypothetical protein SF002_16040 [Alphaproteobacteria bacterium]|nr:hypothetical protein [Alphaproteobacteria bacterium]
MEKPQPRITTAAAAMQQMDIEAEKSRIRRMLERIRNHAAIEDLEALSATVNALNEMLGQSPLPQKLQDQIRMRAFADEQQVLVKHMDRTLRVAVEGARRGRKDVMGQAVRQLKNFIERWQFLQGDQDVLIRIEKELAEVLPKPVEAQPDAAGTEEDHGPPAKTNAPPSGREQRKFVRYTWPKLQVRAADRLFEVADWSLNGLAIGNVGAEELAFLRKRGNIVAIELLEPDHGLRASDKAEIVRHDPNKRVLKLRYASMTNPCSDIARELRRRGVEPR